MKKLITLSLVVAFGTALAFLNASVGRHDAAAFEQSVSKLKQASAQSADALSKSSDAATKLLETATKTANNPDNADGNQSAEMKNSAGEYAKTVAEATQKRDSQAETLNDLKQEAAAFKKRWAADIAKIKDVDLRENEQERFARNWKRIDTNIANAEKCLDAMSLALQHAADVDLVARSISYEVSAGKMELAIDSLSNEVTLATTSLNAASANLLASMDFHAEAPQG